MTAILVNEFNQTAEGRFFLDIYGAPLQDDPWANVGAIAGFMVCFHVAMCFSLAFLQKEQR